MPEYEVAKKNLSQKGTCNVEISGVLVTQVELKIKPATSENFRITVNLENSKFYKAAALSSTLKIFAKADNKSCFTVIVL